MRIGMAGLIVVAMMLAMVPSASADFAVDTMGLIQFEDGTTCPYGWTVCEENLNQTFPEEPWCEPTAEKPPFWNYKVSGRAESNDEYVRVWVTSPDEMWYGEKIVKLVDAWEADHPGCGFYEINLVVYEQAQQPDTFTKSLPIGWNLISLPLTPLDSSTSAVLGNDTVVYDAVNSYNATSKLFETATTMAPGTGYFVHVTTAGDWEYEGTSVSSTSPGLKSGLNMIGVPNCPMSVGAAMGSADYRYVARWNADDQKYEVYNPSAPEAFYGFTEMTAGEGYFVSAKSEDAGWTVSCLS